MTPLAAENQHANCSFVLTETTKTFFLKSNPISGKKTLLQLIVNSVKCLLCGKTLDWTNKIASIKSNMRPKATLYILGKWGKRWKMIIGKRWDIYSLQLWNLGLGGPLSWSSVQGIPGYGLRWYGLRLTTNSDFIVGGPLTQRSLLPKGPHHHHHPLVLELKCNCF